MELEVDSAEKEASEVLHTLLSVERLEKIDKQSTQHALTNQTTSTFITTNENGQEVQWTTTPVLFTNDQYQTIEEHQVIWEEAEPETPGQLVSIYTNQIPVKNEENTIVEELEDDLEEEPLSIEHKDLLIEDDKLEPEQDDEEEEIDVVRKKPKPKTPIRRPKQKSAVKRVGAKPPHVKNPKDYGDPTKLEKNASQVQDRFKRGCECQDESCFLGLNPESVYKHRLNIAELTKGEHDMYLMGVTMACLANPDTTVRQKERRRLRAQYVYQGRRVCLDAFLYLENCTHYQLKRIRKHVMTHGVAPRVHGNHGKKPHNTFSLDIYRHATEFLKQYMEQHTQNSTTGVSVNPGGAGAKQPIQLPWDITRKNLHDAYKEYGQILEPGIKLMGYSTFRHFMKEQFPHVKFSKVEPKPCTMHNGQCQDRFQSNQSQDVEPTPSIIIQSQPQTTSQTIPEPNLTSTNNTINNQNTQPTQNAQKSVNLNVVNVGNLNNVGLGMNVNVENQNIIQKCVLSNDVQQVIPLVVGPNDSNVNVSVGVGGQTQAYIVTPVQQIINSGGNVNVAGVSGNTFSYQLANGYVINEQGNIVTTMANAQTPFTFSRI